MQKIMRFGLIALVVFATTIGVFAQEPPHPDDEEMGGGIENGGPIRNPSGGGAPLFGGLELLLLLGTGYGLTKVYRKNEKSTSVK